jgi:hypothetical protein
MNDSQVQRPTEPVLAAIQPFLHKAISIWDFYWKMAWRLPRKKERPRRCRRGRGRILMRGSYTHLHRGQIEAANTNVHHRCRIVTARSSTTAPPIQPLLALQSLTRPAGDTSQPRSTA